jgi:hypothetical protein
MRKLLLLFFIGFIALTKCVNAQQVTVTGTVTSASDGSTMPFVSVGVKGTNNAVATDMEGKYSIQNVSSTDTLLFSFVGYTTQKIKVGEQKTINVKLKSNSKELEEVVVTALGVN